MAVKRFQMNVGRFRPRLGLGLRVHRAHGVVVALLLATAALSACFDPRVRGPASVTCAKDEDCPPPLQCVAARGRCFSAAQIAGETCGDGFRAASGREECDDGDENNDLLPDACRTDCTSARCGDGVVDRGETCDDGNDVADDACPAQCIEAICGDGLLAPSELCDDGNRSSGDGCRSDCLKIEVCGDVVVDEDEECDDGNDNPNDACDHCETPRWETTLLTGFGAEGGLAETIALSSPTGVALAPDGALYVSDTAQHRLLRVDSAGNAVVVAGDGQEGFSGDGGPATAARLSSPTAVVVDGFGRVVFVDGKRSRVRMIDIDGRITSLAGNGAQVGLTCGGTNALDTRFHEVVDVAVAADGSVWVADQACDQIQRIDGAGGLSCVVGCGASAYYEAMPLRDLRFAVMGSLQALPDGETLLLDLGAQRILRRYADGRGSRLLEEGGLPLSEGVLVNQIDFQNSRISLAMLDPEGQLMLVQEAMVWRTGTGGVVERWAGGGDELPAVGLPARTILLQHIAHVDVDALGGVAIVDRDLHQVIVVREGVVTQVVGSGAEGFHGEGGPATSARLASGSDLALDRDGRLLVADDQLRRIFAIDANGTFRSVVGGGTEDPPCAASELALQSPWAVTTQTDGTMWIVDGGRILAVDPEGEVTLRGGEGTVALDDTPLLVDADVAAVVELVAAPDGSLVGIDRWNERLFRIDVDDRVSWMTAPYERSELASDGGAVEDLQLESIKAIDIDDTGNVFVLTSQFLWRLGVDGVATLMAGGGASTEFEGLQARNADLSFAFPALTLDALDRPVVALGSYVVRLEESGRFNLLAGGDGPAVEGGPAVGVSVGQQVAIQAKDDEVFLLDGAVVRVVHDDETWSTVVGRTPFLSLGPFERAAVPGATAAASVGDQILVGTALGLLLRVSLSDESVSLVLGAHNGLTLDETARPAVQMAPLPDVAGLAFDGVDNVYLSSSQGHFLARLELVDPADPDTWLLSRLAGGAEGFVDGAFDEARFFSPHGISAQGTTLLVADRDNHAIRAVDLVSQRVTTRAGGPGREGFAGDGRPCLGASLSRPEAVLHDGDGFVFADTGNHRVRSEGADGRCVTLLGNGTASDAGQGALASLFPTASPRALSRDDYGNVVVVSPRAVRILAPLREDIDTNAMVTTVFDGRRLTGDDSVSLEVRTRCLSAVTPGVRNDFFVVDACAGSLLRFARQFR